MILLFGDLTMTKQERITAVAAAIERHKETTKIVNKPIIGGDGNSYGYHSVIELDSEQLAELLVEEGIGSLRDFKAEIVNLYLKGDIAGLLKVLQEEI